MCWLVSFGVLPAAEKLDGPRCRGDCGPSEVGRRPSESRLLDVPQTAATARQALEPQTDLPGVQAHAAESSARCQTQTAEARTRCTLRATAPGYGLVGRLHERCAQLRAALSPLQRRR